MRRCEFLHGCHFDEVLEFIVKFKVSFTYPDLCYFNSLVIMLNSCDNLVIVCEFNSKVSNLILFDGFLERERVLLYFTREDEQLSNKNNITSTEACHIHKCVFSRLQGANKYPLGDVENRHVLLNSAYIHGSLPFWAKFSDEVV